MKFWIIAAIGVMTALVAGLVIVACHTQAPAHKPARINITHTEVFHTTNYKGQKCVLTINPVPEPDSFTCTNA